MDTCVIYRTADQYAIYKLHSTPAVTYGINLAINLRQTYSRILHINNSGIFADRTFYSGLILSDRRFPPRGPKWGSALDQDYCRGHIIDAHISIAAIEIHGDSLTSPTGTYAPSQSVPSARIIKPSLSPRPTIWQHRCRKLR